MNKAANRVTKSQKRGTKSKPRSKRVSDIISLKTENPRLTTSEIGKLVDCDHSNVVRVLQRYGIVARDTEEYKSYRADIFAGLQGKLLSSVTDKEIEKAALQVKITSAAILYDKERTERNLSNSNVAVIERKFQEIQSLEQSE
jgi:hypothetical protein